MPVEKPFTYQNILDRWADGLKVLGAGNGAGLLASGASFQFFSKNPDVVGTIKWAAAFFLLGIFLFAVAFFVLTILPLAIERVVFTSRGNFHSFRQMSFALAKDRDNAKPYIIFILASIFSLICFMVGLFQAMFIIQKI